MAALYDGDDNRVFILVKNETLTSLPHLAELQFYLRFHCLVRVSFLQSIPTSRKEGKHTYQLFKREEKKKSPYTSPNGEEHSLFWYGFSQNVLQSLSTLSQTIGTIWHEIFDDVSTAYHKKVAKDRANDEGLVINPPDLGNLPGEGEVTYASQVKEVLIPYTTREDTFNYYEERNYVNDVNRAHTEVLQTYDRELKASETYTYGQERLSYLNHERGNTFTI